MESFRNQDMRAEQRLGEFMDDYFYSKLTAKDGGDISFKRMSDRDSQLQGIDVCIETAGRKMIIDEKASVYYSNAMIPTFAFELDSIQRGHKEPVEGWFINDSLATEYYMLIWPNVKCSQVDGKWIRRDIGDIRKEDFTIVEAMLIEKSDIRITLEHAGYSRNHLIEYAKRFRAMNEPVVTKKEEQVIENVKIMYSSQLAEKPINLVIRKELLRDLAKAVYLISPDGFATIKG